MISSKQAFELVQAPGAQRWLHRKARYRPIGELFEPSRHAVSPIPAVAARSFVETHHYSGSFVADRLSVGLFERSKPHLPHRLVGCATFSVPAGPAVLHKHLGVGLEAGIELGRFVLLDEVPCNAESWFLARARRVLRSELGISRLLACADPVPRVAADGTQIKPGHTGVVYQASNATFAGTTRPRMLLVLPTGKVFNERTYGKLKRGESGADGAISQLSAAGAPPRDLGESGERYLLRLHELQFFRRLRHSGNLVFTW